jgi:glutamyl-tRNA reductase
MGQLAADTLVAEGADVTVTIRQYKSGMVLVPKHCRQILYDDRYRAMKNCDYVFSATASPNVTITKKKLEQNMPDGPAVFVDLAVPRDIESTITEISGLTLYNIDTLPIDKVSDEMHMQMKAAEEILGKELEEYRRMAAAKKYLPALKNVSNAAAQEIIRRSSKAISGALVPHEAKGTLEKMIASNSEKVVSRMLFLMRDVLEPDQFLDCLEELEKTMV